MLFGNVDDSTQAFHKKDEEAGEDKVTFINSFGGGKGGTSNSIYYNGKEQGVC